MSEARQTPLPDLLDRFPDDIVLGIPGDEPMFPSYTYIPIGKYARQAAAELRRLHAQRDALLEALRGLLSYANVLEMRLLDADGEHRAMKQARAAIAKAEEQT